MYLIWITEKSFKNWWWFSRSVVFNSCNPMDYSPPGSSVHGMSQVRIQGVGCPALPSPQDRPNSRIRNCFSWIASSLLHCKQILYHWATREEQNLFAKNPRRKPSRCPGTVHQHLGLAEALISTDQGIWKSQLQDFFVIIWKQKEYVKSGKGVHQRCIFHLYAEYIMQNARLDEAQAESKLLEEILITSDMMMTPPLWQKVKRN